jgi:hypothetical protein
MDGGPDKAGSNVSQPTYRNANLQGVLSNTFNPIQCLVGIGDVSSTFGHQLLV